MSSRTWFGYDDHNDTHLDGYVTIQNVREHTGRSMRSATLRFETDHSAQAALTIEQTGSEAFINIEGIKDGGGNAVMALSGNAFVQYWIVGTSNCPLLDVVDQSIVAGTTLNDLNAAPHSTGFTLIENAGSGTAHRSVALNSNITPDYGASNSYQFEIPFLTNKNTTGSSRIITMSVYNNSLSLVTTIQITQNSGGAPSVEEAV